MLSIGGSRAAAAAAAAAEKAKESSAVATGPGGHTHQQHPQQQQQQQAVLTREQLRDLKQIDTIHRCLHFVNSRGVPLHGVTAEGKPLPMHLYFAMLDSCPDLAARLDHRNINCPSLLLSTVTNFYPCFQQRYMLPRLECYYNLHIRLMLHCTYGVLASKQHT
eukprot:scpid93209/ scgid24945/ 